MNVSFRSWVCPLPMKFAFLVAAMHLPQVTEVRLIRAGDQIPVVAEIRVNGKLVGSSVGTSERGIVIEVTPSDELSRWLHDRRDILNRVDGVRYDDAIDYNTAIIRQNPCSSTAFNNRGATWMGRGEFDSALEDLNQAICLDPKSSTAFTNRGNAWSHKQNDEAALSDYNEAIRLDPNNSFAFFNRGNFWKSKRNYDKAIADYSEAIRINPHKMNAIYNRGAAWQAIQDFDRALNDYDEVIHIDPKYARAYNSVAWLRATCPLVRFRDGRAACEYAQKACELDDFTEPYYLGTLAAANAEAGDFAKAIKFQTKALDRVSADEKADFESRLKLYQDNRPYHQPTADITTSPAR